MIRIPDLPAVPTVQDLADRVNMLQGMVNGYSPFGTPGYWTQWDGLTTAGAVSSEYANNFSTNEATYGRALKVLDGLDRIGAQVDNNGLYGERPWETTSTLTVTGAIWGKSTLRIDGNTGLGQAPGSDRLGVTGKTKLTGDLWVTAKAGIGGDAATETLTVTGTQATTSKGAFGSSSVGTEMLTVTGTGAFTSKLAVGASTVGAEMLKVTGSAYVTTTTRLDGNVGIGQAPGSVALEVTGSAIITQALTVDTTTLKVDNSNHRVGVGTASPSYALHVEGNAAFDINTSVPTLFVDDTNHRVGVLTASPSYAFHVEGNAAFDINTSTPTLFVDDTNHRVGVLTASPSVALHVVGGAVVQLDAAVSAPGQITIEGASNSNQQLLIGYNTTSDFGSIQAIKQGTAYEPLKLNPGGGDVLIGASGSVKHGFFGGSGATQQTITGVRTGTLAQLQTVMQNLLTALAASKYNLIIDSTT